jgi:ATP-dependent DNA ligase
MPRPFSERRAILLDALAGAGAPVHVTAATADMEQARRWFEQFEGAGLDGVIAKPAGPAVPAGQAGDVEGEARAHRGLRGGGFRWHKSGPIVGSLLLGLHDAQGALQHVGVAASFPMARRAELVEELAPLRIDDGGAAAAGHPWANWADAQAHESGRLPGAVSRWSAGKNLSWVPLRPERVIEVGYDHMEGTRFRHPVQFRRWRPDRDPASCDYAQLDQPLHYDLADVLR